MDLDTIRDLDAATEALQVWALLFAGKLAIAALILVVAFIVGRFASAAATAPLRKSRGGTLVPIVRKGVLAFTGIVGAVMALDHLGLDVATLLAGAGVVGLAVGFGAQSLVKDLISGFFLLLEDVIRVGDIATMGSITGVVEEVGLRMTQLRSFDGQLWYIPNGEITTVGNFNRDWTRAVVSVGLAYESDVGKGLKVLQAVGDAWAAENPEQVMEPPEAQGVVGLNASDVGVRLIVKTLPGNHWPVERELRLRVKAAFDAEGIEIPFPRQVMYHRQEGDVSALRVEGAAAQAAAK